MRCAAGEPFDDQSGLIIYGSTHVTTDKILSTDGLDALDGEAPSVDDCLCALMRAA